MLGIDQLSYRKFRAFSKCVVSKPDGSTHCRAVRLRVVGIGQKGLLFPFGTALPDSANPVCRNYSIPCIFCLIVPFMAIKTMPAMIGIAV